ncbi:B12-binding domain-containing radical SAM protein [Candidatus Woesearchaeota archaeon]|nr:B12-binding domain-containing radical SAM protein [Candidatus Woesearchaeota archaeon]
MKVTLINPNIVTQKGDFSGTGIPFMPITLAYLASYLRNKGYQISVIDAFGEDPKKIIKDKDFFVQGLDKEEVVSRIPQDSGAVILYTSQVITHTLNINLVKTIKKTLSLPIILVENIHSVVGYSLLKVNDDFLNSGVDFIVLGDPEKRCEDILKSIKNGKIPKTDGVIFNLNGKKLVKTIKTHQKNIDELPFPAWDLFPIKKYWDLAYSHAPINKSYLPLLTSRGCPYNCEFCITPLLTGRVWRPRSPKNVVDEIEYYTKKFKIFEFHIEDFNPTVSKDRIVQICKDILKRKLKIKIKIVAGTKAETIDNKTIDWMKKAGFSYISISPESGSKKVLEKMNKSFDYTHGLNIVKHMHRIGVISQACFVIGFPGENKNDLKLTRDYIKELTKSGIDEIALFIMTPIPGSNACEYSPLGYKDLSHLTFSPKWRSTYKELSRYRLRTYLIFLLWKLRYHPKNLLRHILNIITKRFETKMEMAIWRFLRMHIRVLLGMRL